MMKFGAMHNVLGSELPEVFGIAARLGLDGVELDWYDPAEAEEGGPLAPERRAAIVTAARSAGIEIPSVCAHFHNRGGIASSDPDQRQRGLAAIRAGIGLCRDLGAQVLLVPFFGEGDIGDEDGVERLRQSLQELAPEAEQAGVTLAIEHTLPAERTVALLDQIGSPRIANYWDMANAMFAGYDPVREARVLAPYLAQVHAKEFDGGDGPAASRAQPRWDGLNSRPFGQGQVPIREVLTTLQAAGYDGYVVLETGSFGAPEASARAALDVLRAAVQAQ